MAQAKWFLAFTGRTAARTAARRTLRARLQAVLHFLDRAGSLAASADDVHQLRVATRRLGAALDVFKPYLRRKRRRRLRRAGRQLRRAAGSLRDQDVARQLLEERLADSNQLPPDRVALLRTTIERTRASARRALDRVMARTARQVSADRVSRMLASDRASDAPRRLGELARKTVGRQVARLRKAGRRDLKDLGNLHALRIAAKRLRYAMELFAGCFAAEFRGGLYREVEAVQDELGHVNDLRTLRGMLQARRGAHSLHLRGKGRKQLVRAVRGELVARQSEFVAGWDARRSRLERAFAHMLRPPGAPRRRARRHHQESERIASRSA